MDIESLRGHLYGRSALAATALLAAFTLPARAQAVTPPAPPAAVLQINPRPGYEINPDIYGVNHDWNKVPADKASAWVSSMSSTAGVRLMLYPGGWNPEHYDWLHNTEAPWRNMLKNGFDPAKDAAGADPKTFLTLAPQAAFVTPCESVILDPSTLPQTVALTRGLVHSYGDQVPRWDIGNEWWIQRGGLKLPAILAEDLSRYAQLVAAVVPAMKAENPHISVFVSADWEHPEEYAEIRKLVGPKVWEQVDGVSIHAYCGVSPTCDSVPALTDAVRKASGKDRIFDSQWMIRQRGLPDDSGIKYANRLVLALSDLAQARIEAAIVWPVTSYIPELNFVSDDYQTAYAAGVLFGWMSKDYEGKTLATSGDIKAAASRSGSTVHIILPSMKPGLMQVRIPLSGLDVRKVVSAQVLYSEDADDPDQGRLASVAQLPVKVTADHALLFTLNPGGQGRGSGWEIARITLQ